MKKENKAIPKLRFSEFYEEWRTEKLGNLVTIKSGHSPSTYKFNDGGRFPFFKVEELNNSQVYQETSRFYSNESKNLIEKKSIIFPKRGAAILNNKVRVTQVPSLIDTNLMALKAKDNILHYKFLFFILFSEKLYKIADTSTIPQINNKHIEPYKIKLPSLPEQQKIASFLSAVDKKIEQLTRKKQLLETYKKGVIQQLFSQEIRFKDEDGKNFSQWEKKKFGDLIKSLKSGKTKSDDSGDIDLYGSTGIIGKCKEISNEGTFILIARVGANAGQINLITGQFGVTDNTLILELLKEINQRYIFYFLNYFNLNTLIFGSGQPLITGGLLKNIKLTIPSKVEQQKIADFLSAIDKKIEAVSQQMEKTQSFKKGLLQQMFV